jgi:hypothetical protein
VALSILSKRLCPPGNVPRRGRRQSASGRGEGFWRTNGNQGQHGRSFEANEQIRAHFERISRRWRLEFFGHVHTELAVAGIGWIGDKNPTCGNLEFSKGFALRLQLKIPSAESHPRI